MSESRDPAGDSTTTNNMGEVREAEHQGAAVKAALGANIGVAIAKLCAAFFTGSSAMLSESVHSIADCSNEIVLMVGGRFSKRKTDGDHPFGLYRAKYLASFVVATLLFFVGGFFSTSEAVKKLVAISADPALRDVNRMELLVAFIVVVISACLEGFGLHQSIKEANERMERTNTKHMGVFRFWRHTKSAELASVIMEDTLALIGLAFAGLGIGLAILLDDEIFDALGGLMVGLVLIVGSLFTRVQIRFAAHRRGRGFRYAREDRRGGYHHAGRRTIAEHADRAHVGGRHPPVRQSADQQARPRL